MDEKGDAHPSQIDPADEATLWFARRLDAKSWTAQDEANLEKWLAADPRHMREMQRTVEAWELMVAPGVFHPEEIHRVLSRVPNSNTKRRSRLPLLVGITAAAAMLAFGLFILLRGEVISTAPGELRKVVLEDGTEAHLDAATTLVCKFTDSRRLIVLKTGGAVFHVAAVQDRPFEVHTTDCTIRDIGTTFDVHLREAPSDRGTIKTDVEVSVEEGEVEIRHLQATQEQSLRLMAGEQVLWSSDGRAARKDKAGAGTFASWRDGRLRYRERPLRHLIADLQRHSGQKVLLADSRLGEMKVTGTFHSTDLRGALEVLREILPIKVSEKGARGTVIEADEKRLKKP